MTAYRTACLGFEYLLEFAKLLHRFVCNIDYFLVAWRMRDEYTLVINIISARKTLGDVFFLYKRHICLCILPTLIFPSLTSMHGRVKADLHPVPQVQNIFRPFSESRAFQLQSWLQLWILRAFIAPFTISSGFSPACAIFCRTKHDQTTACGKITAVDDINIVEVFCRNAGHSDSDLKNPHLYQRG